MKTQTLRLILDVTYESEDGSPLNLDALQENLQYIAHNASGHGLMSQGTQAYVTEWHATVEKKL